MNNDWQDIPDSQGIWWAVNPDFPHKYMVAKILYEGGRMTPKLRIHFAGEHRDYPLDHFKSLKWQKAIMPIYHWTESES